MEYKEVLNRKQPPQTFYEAVEYAVLSAEDAAAALPAAAAG